MRKLKKRARRLLLLYMSLIVLSSVLVVLLAVQYPAYITYQREHALTVQSKDSIPVVGGSLQQTAFPNEDDIKAPSEQPNQSEEQISEDGNLKNEEQDVTPVPSVPKFTRGTFSSADIAFGDSELLSLFSYEKGEGSCCISSGLTITEISDVTFDVDTRFSKSQTAEQLLSINTYNSCYLFFGLKESEWYYPDAFLERYESFLQRAKELQPDAKIYIHEIPTVSELEALGYKTAATDEQIDLLNQKLDALAAANEAVFVLYN